MTTAAGPPPSRRDLDAAPGVGCGLDRIDWADLSETAALLGEPLASVLVLRLRDDASADQIRVRVDLGEMNPHRLISHVERRYDDLVRARAIWRNSKLQCATLRATVEGAEEFTTPVADAILDHIVRCACCYRAGFLALPPCELYRRALHSDLS